MPEVLKEEKQKLDMLHQQMDEAQKQLGQPFPQEESLKEKTKRLEELAAELDMDSSKETGPDDEVIKKKIQKQTEDMSLKQSRFPQFRKERMERQVGMEY